MDEVRPESGEKPRDFDVNFGDGKVSHVDEDVYEFLIDLQKKLKSEKPKLPFFHDLSSKIKDYEEYLLEFYIHILKHQNMSTSQLFQDLFVHFIHNGKTNGTFLEFGATNGVELSNSLMLEEKFGWTGVLAEPNHQWHSELFENRPNATILTDCIYSESNKHLDFFVSDYGELSTLDEFRTSDIEGMPGNAKMRNASGYNWVINTISLNDVISKYFNGTKIDYMSVDTEGSELVILKHFDFSKFAPKVVTVEHNFTDGQKELDELFLTNNYRRFFKEYTEFDAWYVLQE